MAKKIEDLDETAPIIAEPKPALDLTISHGTKLHTVSYADGVLTVRRRSDSAVVASEKMPKQEVAAFMSGFRIAFGL